MTSDIDTSLQWNTQRFQKLTYLHLFTDCFMKISPQSLVRILFEIFVHKAL